MRVVYNKKAIAYISNGDIDTSKYVSDKYALNDVMKAFEDIRDRGIMKAIITPFGNADDRA
jgi:L-iditol 2-dehydrogenase